MTNRRRLGFTLIELLVVIAIIAILAAILFPVFAQAKVAAKKAAAISDMKQMVLAVQMYANDSDDVVNPRARQGFGPGNGGDPSQALTFEFFLHPYVKAANMFTSNTDAGTKYSSPIGSYRRSYTVAPNAFKGWQIRPGYQGITYTTKSSQSLTSYPQPAGTVGIGEQRLVEPSTPDPQLWTKAGWYNGSFMENTRRFPQPADCGWAKETWAQTGVRNNYTDGAVWGFMDGHASWVKANGRPATGPRDKCQGTVFQGYEQKAGAWVGTPDPTWDNGSSCMDSNPDASKGDCKIAGE